MAESVRLEITVDDKGSPVIKAVSDKLEGLGKSAQTAAGGQLKLNDAATAGTGILGDFGIQVGGVVSRVASALGPIGMLTATVGTGLVAAALHASNQFQQFAFQVRDLSYLSGGSAKDVSGLITAMEDLGVESGTVQLGINKMSQAIAAGDPTLQRLGITIRTQGGALKDGLTLYYETIDALGGMRNEVERNRAAQEIFGRGWTQMLPAIQKGSGALKEMGAENAALGKTMSEGRIRAAENYRQAVNDLKDVAEGLTIAWGNRLIPTMTKWISLLTPSSEAVRYYWDEMGNLRDRVSEAADAYQKLDGEQRRFLASQANAPNHAKPTPQSAYDPTPFEIEQQQKLADIRQKNYAESIGAQKAMLDEADVLGAKFLQDEQKRKEEEAKAEQKIDDEMTAGRIKSYVAMVEEELRIAEELANDEVKRNEEVWAQRDKTTKEYSESEIKYWITRIEQENALYEEQLKDEAVTNEKAAQAREDAYRKSFLNVRGITEDAFAGMNSAVSASIRGVIQGTQTMEQAFKNMGQSIALGLVDSIVNRGLRSVQNALLDTVFGDEKGGGGISWGSLVSLGSSIVSNAGAVAGGIGAAVTSVGSFLGFLDTGMWKVPGGKSAPSGYSGTWGKGAAGVAALHPGEMVVPPDIAELLRRAVAANGGSNFAGMANLLTGGGGRGGTGPGSGSYGQMTAAERSSLSSLGGFGSFGTLSTSFGIASGLLGMGPLGKASIDAMISGILGFDAVRGMLGVDPAIGYVSPTAADYQGIADTYGYASRQENEARTAAAIGQSLIGDIDAARAGQAAVAAGEAEAANRAAEAQEASQRDAQGYGDNDPGSDPGGIGHDAGDTGQAGYASGGLFRTRGRTRMTVGEAGSETVAVLRNPREVSMGGGGSQITVNIDLRGSVVDNQVPTNIARAIKKSIDRIESRKINY